METNQSKYDRAMQQWEQNNQLWLKVLSTDRKVVHTTVVLNWVTLVAVWWVLLGS